MTRDDLEYFFEQKHLSKIGVEKPPKSSRPAFCKVLPSRAPCRQRYGKQDTRPTNSTAETLSVEVAGGREKSFSSQGACSMLCMDTLAIEPTAFRMRSGCDTTTPCAPEPLLSWCHPDENMPSSFWLTRSARKSGTHVLSNGKMDAGWRGMI